MYIDPKTGKGNRERTPLDRTARWMSTYSLDESKQRAVLYEDQKLQALKATRNARILKQAQNSKDPEKLITLLTTYEANGGIPDDFFQKLDSHQKERLTSALERAAGIQLNTTKQLQHYLEVMKYYERD